MGKKILIVTMTWIVGFTLLASGSFSGSWSNKITFDPGGGFIKSLDSVFEINYSFGNFVTTSTSELVLSGFIWQGFGVTGRLGAFDIQGDLLFGVSTADFIYDQLIVTTHIAGIEFGFYAAQLSDAVLGGPADGFAVRFAGSAGILDIESISEFGARIEDDDFHGITIYHAATGLHKHYVTNPIVPGQGFTGEKLTLSGWSFGCVEDIATTLYMTCENGFEFIKFSLTEIESGIAWLNFDLDLTFTLQTKSLVLTPTVVWEEFGCLEVYAIIDETSGAISGLSFYGLGMTAAWSGVSFKALSVLDTGHYAITTPEYGSVIEEIAEAIENGHDFYPDYWELFSIVVTGDGCCGGEYTFLANTYFNKDSASLFDWGMTHAEVVIPIGSDFLLSGTVEVTSSGLDHFGLGVKLGW